MTVDLDGMAVFVAVAELRGFRAAGVHLGVSGSAVSQALRKFEERLGVVLVQRTTRSVHLTEAGQQLYQSARPAMDELRAAVSAIGELTHEPRGTLRLRVSSAADAFLEGGLLASFLERHPQVRLDIIVANERVDIVSEGYDAGVQLFEWIERDMIAVPVSGDLRLVVVGTPSYFARHPKPTHPRDLADHVCVNWHASATTLPYRWEFTENGREMTVSVPWRVLSNDPQFNLRLIRAGSGLGLALDPYVRDDIARGDLIAVLDEYCTPFPGYYLHYPERRKPSLALQALVAHVQRHTTRAKSVRARNR